MSNYPARVVDAIEMLRVIEKAVVEDSLSRIGLSLDRSEMEKFIIDQRGRVSNAVRIFCSQSVGS